MWSHWSASSTYGVLAVTKWASIEHWMQQTTHQLNWMFQPQKPSSAVESLCSQNIQFSWPVFFHSHSIEAHLIFPPVAVSLYGTVLVVLSFRQTGPLMVSIKGGLDSDETNKGILISEIREGGAAHQYSERHTHILPTKHTHALINTSMSTHICTTVHTNHTKNAATNSLSISHTHTHTHVHTHTTRAHTHTHTHTQHTCMHARTHTNAHTHAHTQHARTHVHTFHCGSRYMYLTMHSLIINQLFHGCC